MIPGQDVYGTKAECDRLTEKLKHHQRELRWARWFYSILGGVFGALLMMFVVSVLDMYVHNDEVPKVDCWRVVTNTSRVASVKVKAYGITSKPANPVVREFDSEPEALAHLSAWHQGLCKEDIVRVTPPEAGMVLTWEKAGEATLTPPVPEKGRISCWVDRKDEKHPTTKCMGDDSVPVVVEERP